MTMVPAKSRQPGRPVRKDKKPAAATGKTSSELTAIVLVVILAGIPFALGRYFEFSYPDPFDSAANVYSAQHILNGAKIGIDEKPSAALGTLLVNILGVRLFGFSEFGPKLLQSIMQACALAAMYIAIRKLMGKLPAAVSVIIASIYISAPFIAKFGNVKEQYMIACMATAISLFMLRQSGGGWWYSLLAGAIVSWAPLFKETGASAIGAIGLFVILQPIFKHRTWKQTGIDIALLLAGAITAIAPLYIWIIGWKVPLSLPYSFAWEAVRGFLPAQQTSPQADTYVSSLRAMLPFSEQWPRVLRFYLALCLPVSLAAGSIIARFGKIILKLSGKLLPDSDRCDYDRFVPLFAVWWLLDMAFVWVSPASYEQYYLPLTASGAMTGGYLIAVWRDKLIKAVLKTKWVVTGIGSLVLMVIMCWHIFFGLPRSPYSGVKYPEKRNGYVQRWNEIKHRRYDGWKGPWEVTGEYVRSHTQPSDKIYVWGWVPGIYLSAQRFCPAPNAFESEMHARPPQQLEQIVDELLGYFNKEMPKYIVDSRKQHLPLNRFKFELWPIVPAGFMGIQKSQLLPNEPQIIAEFEKQWEQMTRERFGDDEARRFEIMGKFRKFIRENYDIAQMFGDCVVFKLKNQ
ncbi:MAG: glycosyltransferase family 39 protein [Phycisphaerae bacterium]|nr:glycosyltransferase family 39 protein [Phycisphaerae bacterium]